MKTTTITIGNAINEQEWQQGVLPEGWKRTDTSRHGYYIPDGHGQSNIPHYFKKAKYEEDCEWAIPVYFNRHLFPLSVVTQAESTLRNWFPYEWEMYLGRKLQKGESQSKDNNYWAILENIGKWQSVTAYGDWCFDIPKGYVYLRLIRVESHQATYSINVPQGQELHALVTEEQYHQSNGFFESSELTPYDRNEDYYTWREYTEVTSQPRYK